MVLVGREAAGDPWKGRGLFAVEVLVEMATESGCGSDQSTGIRSAPIDEVVERLR